MNTKTLTLHVLILGAICAGTLSGCGMLSPALSEEETALCSADFNQCLGDLADNLSDKDYDSLYETFTSIWPARQKREARGEAEMGFLEKFRLGRFSQRLDDLTAEIFGDVDYYYPDSTEVTLADYTVNGDGSLGTGEVYAAWSDYDYDQADLTALWEQAGAILPDGALSVFDTYTVFTDGEDGTVAYVYWDDTAEVLTWGLALDPADTDDPDYLKETILHEYFHYLSLNNTQAEYQVEGDGSTYAEPDISMVTKSDSYLNLFYQEFWPDILKDERLANPDSLQFFPRHYSEFYDDYASTSPSEDIAECFTCYVLLEDGWEAEYEDAVWVQKINWFAQFEDLKKFRTQVQEKLSDIGTGRGGALTQGVTSALSAAV